ncbi:MAG TPA: hypothetical protein VJ718_01000 [Candidatus Binataceae bacterium]|nr:hypothetical protein [Candidatus Binataceae bacterium]
MESHRRDYPRIAPIVGFEHVEDCSGEGRCALCASYRTGRNGAYCSADGALVGDFAEACGAAAGEAGLWSVLTVGVANA